MNRQLIYLLLIVIFSGCGSVSPDAGEEAVLIFKPWIFGSGGVSEDPVPTGLVWKAWSTSYEIYNIKPYKITEKFNDLVTSNNLPVDFNVFLKVQIKSGKTPHLHLKKGKQWYEENYQEPFRTMVRNRARTYKAFQLVSDSEIINQMQNKLLEEIRNLIAKEELHIIVHDVIIGKVRLPDQVIQETINTAAQKQRKKTQVSRAEAELSRALAEKNKALADKAYAKNFGMTTKDYLELRRIEIQREMLEIVKSKNNISVILGGAVPTKMVQ